jgi:hypothetical protein
LALKFFPLHRSGSGFVQSGFYEVALIPALRATPRNATSQNPPDSKSVLVPIQILRANGPSPSNRGAISA